MSRLAGRGSLRLILAALLLLVVIHSLTIPYHAGLQQAQTIRTVTSPVRYPLPTVPEPALIGGPLRVEVDAGSEAGGWAAKLTSDYGAYFLTMINGSYAEDRGWTLFFEVPETLHPELHSLNIAYSDEGDTINYTQPRSVWILEEWPDRLTICHISDSHLGASPYGADVFATSVYEINLIQPDIVIHTGDVVDIETITSAWIYLQRILDWLEVPSYLLPGNHDYAGARSAYYQRFCGQLNYSADMGNFLFVALDATDAGYVELNQLQWAERVLQGQPDKVKIMGFHYPIFSEDDGGNITGSWEEIEKLKDYMYPSWWEHPIEACELLRLIEEYDVRLVLAGHIHRDVVYVYNNRHYFVTTTTCGGSLRHGDYHGSRLIEIDTEGNVGFDEYAERRLFDPPNSIPTGNITYYYKAANDGTENAVSATIINGLERRLEDARLEFHVSSEYPIEDYEFQLAEPTSYETSTTEKGHSFTAYVDVPPMSTLYLTLASVEDKVEPNIDIGLTGKIEEEMPITLTVDVGDEGWGVKGLEISYSTDGGSAWTDVDLPSHLRVNRDEYILDYPTSRYEVTIPGQAGGTELLVGVKAWDYADNSKTYQAIYTIGPPPTTTYTLMIESSPIASLAFTLEDQSHTTPYSATLEEGAYTVAVPTEVPVAGETYNFARWGDGSTDTTRTIDLTSDSTLTVHYEVAPKPTPTEPPPPPKPGMPMWQISAVAAVIAVVVVVVVFMVKKKA